MKPASDVLRLSALLDVLQPALELVGVEAVNHLVLADARPDRRRAARSRASKVIRPNRSWKNTADMPIVAIARAIAAAIGTPSMPQRVDSEPSATATTRGGARLLELADDQRAEVGERRLRPVDRREAVARPASRAGRRSRSPVPWNRLRCSPIVNSRIRLQDEQLDLGELRQVDERRLAGLGSALDLAFLGRRVRIFIRESRTRSMMSLITASVVSPWLAACGPSQMRWPRM